MKKSFIQQASNVYMHTCIYTESKRYFVPCPNIARTVESLKHGVCLFFCFVFGVCVFCSLCLVLPRFQYTKQSFIVKSID